MNQKLFNEAAGHGHFFFMPRNGFVKNSTHRIEVLFYDEAYNDFMK